MPVLGVTGGAATGKSTLVGLLLPKLAGTGFDADRCGRELLTADEEAKCLVRKTFPEADAGNGEVDRLALRQVVFSDPAKRAALEAILHPRIRERWLALAGANRNARDSGWLVVDIPLLYETCGDAHCDRVLVVGCDSSTQMARLRHVRGLRPDVAAGMVAAQWPLERKIAAADHVAWSEGSPAALDEQAALIANYLRHFHG